MTDDELLSRARVFDAGPRPTINHYVLDEDDDSQGHNLTVEYRGETGWAICTGGRSCLDKATGLYAFEAMPTHRDEEYIARTRFATAQDAFAFLAEWKPKARAEALRSGKFFRWKDWLALQEKKRKDGQP